MSSKREWEITRPMVTEPRLAKGATLQELTRLDNGELSAINIANYEIYRPLGKGGMSSVYLAVQHLARSKPVVVKVLTRDLSEFPNAIARFINEARLTDKVKHPNVVEVLDYGTTPGGLAYLVMPLYEGEDLRTIVRREGRLDWPHVRTLLLQLCAALEAVHARSIVHCDVKPSNCLCVMEDGQERLKLLDFGVARQAGGREESVVGTPDYMSPEQARGDDVDARSDIYSLGIMLGELLTGRVPFVGNTVAALLDSQEHEPPPSLAQLAGPNVEFPNELEAIYRRALAKNPAHRFASVSELAAALRAIDEPARMPEWKPSARWRSLALAAGLLLVVGSAWVEASVPVQVWPEAANR
jgi:serine/threonine protein kinase